MINRCPDCPGTEDKHYTACPHYLNPTPPEVEPIGERFGHSMENCTITSASKDAAVHNHVEIVVLKANDELRAAAEDAFFLFDTWIKRGSISGGPYPSEERIIERLRSALSKKEGE